MDAREAAAMPRAKTGMPGVRRARQAGMRRAQELIAEREALASAALSSRGLLVAEGDSWFDYPRRDILDLLEDAHGWDVESVARHGDTLESMAYDDAQLRDLARLLRKLADRGARPRAVLLSGGGNDIAGTEFPVLLNHRRSLLEPLNASVVEGLIDTRLFSAGVALTTAVTTLCDRWFEPPRIPILVHGYDYPVPDGRGFLGGLAWLPGPWLLPGFSRKGYEDAAERLALMRRLMDRHNAMLRRIPKVAGLEHVRYVKLLDTLSSGQDYGDWWANELHPTQAGFAAVAQRFHETLAKL
jgi:lysophospholipase L1-like esterase